MGSSDASTPAKSGDANSAKVPGSPGVGAVRLYRVEWNDIEIHHEETVGAALRLADKPLRDGPHRDDYPGVDATSSRVSGRREG